MGARVPAVASAGEGELSVQETLPDAALGHEGQRLGVGAARINQLRYAKNIQ